MSSLKTNVFFPNTEEVPILQEYICTYHISCAAHFIRILAMMNCEINTEKIYKQKAVAFFSFAREASEVQISRKTFIVLGFKHDTYDVPIEKYNTKQVLFMQMCRWRKRHSVRV